MISIILPVYNASNTLTKCIDSIINQSFTEWELIIVNDGSTDSSSQIIDQYLKKDKRISSLYKTNGGVSSARNFALAIATGTWVTFIDSDDYLEPQYLESLINGQGHDLCVTGYHTVGAHDIREACYKKQSATTPQNIRYVLETHLTDMTFLCPWGKLFSKEIIDKNNLRFKENMRIGEDVVFTWDYISNCSSIYLSEGQYYNYYTEPADFKYVIDSEESLCTIHTILERLAKIKNAFCIDSRKAEDFIYGYYIWLYKLYIKKHYKMIDYGKMKAFFRNPQISTYFSGTKNMSYDRMLVHLCIKHRVEFLLYPLFKIYY